MPTLYRIVEDASLPGLGDVIGVPNTARKQVIYHHHFNTKCYKEWNQGHRYFWKCSSDNPCKFAVTIARDRKGHARIPQPGYVVKESRSHCESCPFYSKCWKVGTDLPSYKVPTAAKAVVPQKGQKGYVAYTRLQQLKKRTTKKWIDRQVDLIVKLTGFKKALQVVYGLVSARDIWRFPLPSKDHPNYGFECFFLLFCSAGISDIPLCKCCKEIFDSTNHGVSAQWVVDTDLEEMVDRMKSMSKQNINAGRLKEISTLLLEKFDGKIPVSFEVLCSFPGVGPKIAALTLWEVHGIVAAIPVDVHLWRIFNCLGWTKAPASVDECRIQVESWLPKIYWPVANELFAGLGQLVGRRRTRDVVVRAISSYNRSVKVALGRLDRATPKAGSNKEKKKYEIEKKAAQDKK